MLTETTTTMTPIGIHIEYLGARQPKVVELPIPLMKKCLKTGEVVCNPVGLFPMAEGRALLALSGKEGLYRFVSYAYPDGQTSGKAELCTDEHGRTLYKTATAVKRAISHRPERGLRYARNLEGFFYIDEHPQDTTPSPEASLLDGDTEPSPDEGRLHEE